MLSPLGESEGAFLITFPSSPLPLCDNNPCIAARILRFRLTVPACRWPRADGSRMLAHRTSRRWHGPLLRRRQWRTVPESGRRARPCSPCRVPPRRPSRPGLPVRCTRRAARCRRTLHSAYQFLGLAREHRAAYYLNATLMMSLAVYVVYCCHTY